MNIKDTISLFAGQSDGSSLINTPHRITDTPKVRDIARKRLVKTNPDVDAGGPGSGRHKTAQHYRKEIEKKGQRKQEKTTNDIPVNKARHGMLSKAHYFLGTQNGVSIYQAKVGNYKLAVKPDGSYSEFKAAKYKEDSQTDENAFVGKKYKVQDTKYGHYTSEHDIKKSADTASLARPYSRVLTQPEPSQVQKNRDKTRKKAIKENPDVQ